MPQLGQRGRCSYSSDVNCRGRPRRAADAAKAKNRECSNAIACREALVNAPALFRKRHVARPVPPPVCVSSKYAVVEPALSDCTSSAGAGGRQGDAQRRRQWPWLRLLQRCSQTRTILRDARPGDALPTQADYACLVPQPSYRTVCLTPAFRTRHTSWARAASCVLLTAGRA